MQAGNNYVIGTDPQTCDIVFHDTSVSRQHARISVTPEDTLFIEVTDCKSRATEGKAFAHVKGELVIFSQNNKLPYGFFSKRVHQATAELHKSLFFFEMDRDIQASQARMLNIHERRCSFVFLFETQYDPKHGAMTTIDFDVKKIVDGDENPIGTGDGDILRK